MRLVVLSDTHMMHEYLPIPKGDVIIHCGDFGLAGDGREVGEALQWFRRLPHPRKICIAGNHDMIAEVDPAFMQDTLGPEVDYLLESSVVIDGFKFWGSPIQPEFMSWAFNRTPEFRLKYWDTHIPEDVDVLVTHCPPRGILDMNFQERLVGCKHLARNVLTRVKPKLHVFGHIHEDYGVQESGETKFLNASVVNLAMQLANPCWVVDIDDAGVRVVL